MSNQLWLQHNKRRPDKLLILIICSLLIAPIVSCSSILLGSLTEGENFYPYQQFGNIYRTALELSCLLVPLLLTGIIFRIKAGWIGLTIAALVFLALSLLWGYANFIIGLSGAVSVDHLESITINSHVYQLAREGRYDSQLSDLWLCNGDESGLWVSCHHIGQSLLSPITMIYNSQTRELTVRNNYELIYTYPVYSERE